MIKLHLSVQNPWHNEDRWPWMDFYQKSWPISKHKTLEVCLDFYPFVLAHVNLDTSCSGRDHAGPGFSLGLFGLGLQFQLIDNRHWDYEKSCWQKYPE